MTGVTATAEGAHTRTRKEEVTISRASLEAAEAESNQWLAITRRAGDSVVVNAASGRVFVASIDGPSLARSFAEWLCAYVDDVEQGEYEVMHDADGSFLAPASAP